jgi:hypothetical protein
MIVGEKPLTLYFIPMISILILLALSVTSLNGENENKSPPPDDLVYTIFSSNIKRFKLYQNNVLVYQGSPEFLTYSGSALVDFETAFSILVEKNEGDTAEFNFFLPERRGEITTIIFPPDLKPSNVILYYENSSDANEITVINFTNSNFTVETRGDQSFTLNQNEKLRLGPEFRTRSGLPISVFSNEYSAFSGVISFEDQDLPRLLIFTEPKLRGSRELYFRFISSNEIESFINKKDSDLE